MSKTKKDEIAIHVNGVGKYFGSEPNLVKALDNVSIDIRRNEFFPSWNLRDVGKPPCLD